MRSKLILVLFSLDKCKSFRITLRSNLNMNNKSHERDPGPTSAGEAKKRSLLFEHERNNSLELFFAFFLGVTTVMTAVPIRRQRPMKQLTYSALFAGRNNR